MTTKVISNDKKIEIIFSYLFSEKKNNEEEFFWNELKREEIKKIDNINKNDEVFDFNNLKTEILGK